MSKMLHVLAFAGDKVSAQQAAQADIVTATARALLSGDVSVFTETQKGVTGKTRVAMAVRDSLAALSETLAALWQARAAASLANCLPGMGDSDKGKRHRAASLASLAALCDYTRGLIDAAPAASGAPGVSLASSIIAGNRERAKGNGQKVTQADRDALAPFAEAVGAAWGRCIVAHVEAVSASDNAAKKAADDVKPASEGTQQPASEGTQQPASEGTQADPAKAPTMQPANIPPALALAALLTLAPGEFAALARKTPGEFHALAMLVQGVTQAPDNDGTDYTPQQPASDEATQAARAAADAIESAALAAREAARVAHEAAQSARTINTPDGTVIESADKPAKPSRKGRKVTA